MSERKHLSIPVAEITERNYRIHFDESKLQELADSITQYGILQPLLVRPIETGYELVYGARRYRAAKLAGLLEVPCDIKQMSDGEFYEIQLLENFQREDTHPLENADGLQRLVDSGEYGSGNAAVKRIADKIGKSERWVYDQLAFKKLSEKAREDFAAGKLTASHCVLLSRLDEKKQEEVLKACCSYDGTYSSSRNMQYHIGNGYLPLKQAPFSLSEGNLLKDVPACGLCPKNTSVDRLRFAEFDLALCTDQSCFKRKTAAYEQRTLAEVEAATNQKPVLLNAATWGGSRKGSLRLNTDWKLAPAGAENTVVGVVVEGAHDKFPLYSSHWVVLLERSDTGNGNGRNWEQEEKDRQAVVAKAQEERERLAVHIFEYLDGPTEDILRPLILSRLGGLHSKAQMRVIARCLFEEEIEEVTRDLFEKALNRLTSTEMFRLLVLMFVADDVYPGYLGTAPAPVMNAIATAVGLQTIAVPADEDEDEEETEGSQSPVQESGCDTTSSSTAEAPSDPLTNCDPADEQELTAV
jgi:ParB/RepB/Spo0J family partition protein